jgi:F-type H+-transporting ATPase subunit epsilon
MATFRFNLVSPEQILFSGEVEHVVVPGSEGEFGVLAGHAPLISSLRPGILKILGPGEPQRIMVIGGFAEVTPDGLTVLADMAVPVEEFDASLIADQIKDIEEDIADSKSDRERDKLRQKLEQLRAVQAALGR